MFCPNINSKEYKQMEAVLGSEMAQHVWRVSQERLANRNGMSQSARLKQVKELFGSNPELANIGTPEQYSQYLDTIFPDSKVKDIVYHGSPKEIKGDLIPSEKGTFGKGIYFTKIKEGAKDFAYTDEQLDGFGFPKMGEKEPKGSIKAAIINTKNPQNISVYSSEYNQLETGNKVFDSKNIAKEITGDSVIGDRKLNTTTGLEYVVFELEQIHILGSKQDVEGFKEFVQEEGVNKIEQGSTEAPSLYDNYVSKYALDEGIKRFANNALGEDLFNVEENEYPERDGESFAERIARVKRNINIRKRKQIANKYGIKQGQLYSFSELEKLLDESMFDNDIYNDLRDILPQVTFRFGGLNKYKISINGYYDSTTGTISLELWNLENRDFKRILLHEIIHAATFINLAEGAILTDTQKRALNNLNALLEELRNDSDFFSEYGLKNANELLAELANRNFVSKLKKKTFSDNQSFFEKIISEITKLLGLKTTAYDIVKEAYDSLVKEYSGINQITSQQRQEPIETQPLYDEYVSKYGAYEGIKRFANKVLGLPEDSGLDQRNDYTLKVNQVLENRKHARAVDVLVSAIERAMPGVRVHRETNQSMREKGQDPNQSGFVDSDGYHLNLDRITTRTPIHELSHVFMAIIKVENKKLYDRMMQQLDDMIQDSPVFEAMRKKYPNKSTEQLKDEYMAQLAGFYSEKHIQAFIEAQNLHVHSTATENEYASTRGLFRTIWDNIRKLMNSIMGWDIERENMENMSIQQIFETLTVKAMSGQPIPYMNGDKMEIIKDAFYDIQANFSDDKIDDDIYLNMEQQKEVKFVRSVKDIPHILINNSDPGAFAGSAEYWEGNKDAFADNIMRRLYQPTGSNKIYVEWMGKRYEFEAGSTEDTLRNRIIAEVLRDHVKRITSIPSSVMKTVERYYGNPVGDESLESIINQEFSDSQDRMTVQIPEIMRLMNLIGAEDNVVAVMSLSDFMNSEYSSEFRMMDTAIIGNNPIVIVHEATPGTIDISISDINTGDLSFNGVYTNNQRKLGARFMQDYQNPITQNAWTNSKMDTQAAALVTTIAGLRHIAQKAGIRINIRRAGVYGIRGGSSGAINAKAIYDFKDAFMQVRSVMQMDGMQALLQSNFLKDVIADDKAWDAETLDTNVLHQLESFYTNEKIYENLSQGMIGYIVGTKGSKLEQEDAIRRRMSYLINHRTAGDVHSGAEYQLLAKAYLYVKRGWTMGTMNFDDMTSVGKQILNGHNIGNSLAQYAILEMETAKSMVVSKADAFGKEFNKHVENIRKIRKITDTDPKEIFGRLHPEVEVIVDRKYEKTSEHEELNEGDRIKIRLNNELYSNSYPDKELIQRMLDSGQITKEELDFADFLLEKIREIYIDDMYTRGKAHNMDYTLEMAEDEFDKNYTPGTIPVLPATNMELFRMGHMKTWMDNMLTLMSRGDLQYGDMSTKDFGDITSRFRMQLHSSAQLDAMGLRKVTDPVTGITEYRSIDLDKAFLQSKNLEYTLKFFQMDMTRIKIFNKYIVPLKHDIYAIAAMVKSGTGNGLEGTLSWFNEYYKLIVERQHKDHNSKNKFEAIASPVVRSVVQLNTFINIGFRPVIWLKSAYFNEQSSLIASLANSAANMGDVTEKWNFPTVKETLKAHKLIFTDLKKVWRLAEKFQLINGTERDILQNIAKISTDKHMFRQQIAHLGNHYGDAAARTMSMIAFLIHDGTYDAYDYNEETDEITYDAKKDRRLFNEDGTYKEGMDVVHKAIILEQERQGLYTGKQEIGYDFEEINNRMKWYSDKFIIGSMDNHQKTLFGNQYMGAALGQFRTFMWDKLWNFGWGRITTEYGGSFAPVKNEKGEYIAVRQQQEIAGMINSFGQTFKHLKKVLNQDASFWVDMAPVDRRNMADFGIRAMLLGLMVSLFALASDDDDDEETRKEKQRFIAEIMRRDPNMSRDEALSRWRKHKGYALSATDRQKLEFLWQDIFVWDTVTNFYDNPIPALRVIKDIYELAAGRDRLKRIIRYVGPANDAVWLYSLFTKHDDPFKGDLSNNERKKLQEERELEKEYQEMQERLSSSDIDWSKYTDF